MYAPGTAEGARDRCMAAGANDFVTKPLQSTDLLMRVGKLLEVATRKNTQLLAQVTLRGENASAAPVVGRILNLSTTGLLLEMDTPLDLGVEVSLTFVVPGSRLLARGVGRVVRRAAGRDKWGLRFIILDEGARQALKDYIGQT